MARFEHTFPPYVPLGSRILVLQTPNLRGTDVAIVQALYNLLVNTVNVPSGAIGSNITLDGIYGPETKGAVMTLQKYFGLVPSGVVDAQTYLLFGQAVGPYVPFGGPNYGSRKLHEGEFGGDVWVLQNRLNANATSIGHPATGSFDAQTGQAVKDYKAFVEALNQDTGQTSDEVADHGFFDATWLYSPLGGRQLFFETAGIDVLWLQLLLTQLAYYSGPLSGIFDVNTRNAVIAFQTAKGLSPDGIVGALTIFELGQENKFPAPYPIGTAWPQVYCCFVLLPTAASQNLTGGGVALINDSRISGTVSRAGQVDLAAGLPNPSQYGPDYIGYVVSVEGFPPTAMTQSGVDGVWLAAVGTSAGGPIVQAKVTITPATAGGILGPVILKGSGTCM